MAGIQISYPEADKYYADIAAGKGTPGEQEAAAAAAGGTGTGTATGKVVSTPSGSFQTYTRTDGSTYQSAVNPDGSPIAPSPSYTPQEMSGGIRVGGDTRTPEQIVADDQKALTQYQGALAQYAGQSTPSAGQQPTDGQLAYEPGGGLPTPDGAQTMTSSGTQSATVAPVPKNVGTGAFNYGNGSVSVVKSNPDGSITWAVWDGSKTTNETLTADQFAQKYGVENALKYYGNTLTTTGQYPIQNFDMAGSKFTSEGNDYGFTLNPDGTIRIKRLTNDQFDFGNMSQLDFARYWGADALRQITNSGGAGAPPPGGTGGVGGNTGGAPAGPNIGGDTNQGQFGDPSFLQQNGYQGIQPPQGTGAIGYAMPAAAVNPNAPGNTTPQTVVIGYNADGTPITTTINPIATPSVPTTPQMAKYDAAQADQTYDQTVEGRVLGMLASGNPLLEKAASMTMQKANSRGLLNSSMAQEAAMSAMMQNAIPIAQADANISSQIALQNASFDNAATQFSVQQYNDMAKTGFLANAELQKAAFSANSEMQKLIAAGQIDGAMQLLKVQSDAALKEIDERMGDKVRASTSASQTLTQLQAGITGILSSNLDASAKTSAVAQLVAHARASLSVYSSLSGNINLVEQFDAVIGAPSTGGGGTENPSGAAGGDTGGNPASGIAGDLNNDGFLDANEWYALTGRFPGQTDGN